MLACPCDTPPANGTTAWYLVKARYDQLMNLNVNVIENQTLERSDPRMLKRNLCLYESETCWYPEKKNFEDVCSELIPFRDNFQERNSSVLYGESFDCPWIYKCEYEPKRIPAIMLHAECEQPPDGEKYGCQEIRYRTPVLKTTECPLTGNDRWELSLELITVGCARYSL